PACVLLNSVRGSLQMLPLQRAALLVAGCRDYLQEQLIDAAIVPDWLALDALADVVTSVDYYLERLADDDSDRSEGILGMAEEALQGLTGIQTEVPVLQLPTREPEVIPLLQTEIDEQAE